MPQNKNKSSLRIPPFKLASFGDVHKKTNQFHLPRKFPWENHATCRSKTKTTVWFWLFHATCKKSWTCSGVLSSGTNCGQNGLCKFFVIHTGCCPVDIIHPCMFLTLAPTKTLCEQIAKTSWRTTKDKRFTDRQSVWCLHTGLTQKHFSIKLQTTLFQNSFGLFAFPYVVVSGQFERPRIPKQQILRDVLHDTFPWPVCLWFNRCRKILEWRSWATRSRSAHMHPTVAFFSLEYGRCRTVARSLHEHKQ